MIRSSILLACIAAAPHFAQSQQQTPPSTQATIEVIAVTPVDGVGVDLDRYPANAQAITPGRNDLAAVTLIDRGAGVQLNEAQGNRFQPDISFRGFLASPLLGVPQGVAVFQDGVRLNEPFGDVVHWDALFEPMVANLQIIPGSNAAFGLNALGGVITLRTKTGLTDPGVSAQFGGGSFGSRFLDASSGWTRGSVSYFLAVSHQDEDGWRDFAPSRLEHLFGSVKWIRGRGSSDLRATAAETMLTGNGAAPVQLLEEDRSAVFTHPDETWNRIVLLSSAHHQLTRAGLWEVNAFTRRTTTRTRNGDESPYEPCEGSELLLCEDDSDEVVVDPDGEPFRRTAEHPLDAVLNRSTTAQTAIGANVQLSRPFRAFGDEHRASAGLSYDRGSADFALDAELADLTAARGAEGIGRIAAESIVGLDATTSTTSAYITDVVSLTPRMTVTAAARFNRSTIRLRDRIGDDLSGDHRFTSINPSLGFAFAAGPLTAFASVGQASRTPTPVELTCANPDDPCRLPNAFVSDPPLEQVIARTAEIGVRGRAADLRWSAAAFRSANENDILFISSGRLLGHGYFTNAGRTVRRGIEAALDGVVRKRFRWNASYSLIDATFERAFVVASPHHPMAEDGEISVLPGDRLPLIPRHTAKIGVNVRVTDAVQVAADARYTSTAFLRGDEANLAPPLSDSLLLDLGTTIRIAPRVAIDVVLTNAADVESATFGTFGDASEVLGDEYDDPMFVSPIQPRALRVSVRYRR